MSRPLAVLAALATALVLVLGAAPMSRAADVHGDDERDRYVGTGGLILPGTTDDRTRQEVAGCGDCAWRMTSPCVAAVLGNPFGSGCTSVVRGCPGGELLRAWLRPAQGSWREVGLVCIGPGGPLTVARAAQAARDRVTRGIPPLVPAFDPPQGVLAQLPVRFRSGQRPGERQWRMALAGADVTIAAEPTWTWTFGDGDQATDRDRGQVEHGYRQSTLFRVTCTSTWSARFRVDGLGPFPVTEPVSQEVTVTVAVGEGRALLVPD